MRDQDLRELERRFAQSGDFEDEVRLVRARLGSGLLPRRRVCYAAWALGQPVAQSAIGPWTTEVGGDLGSFGAFERRQAMFMIWHARRWPRNAASEDCRRSWIRPGVADGVRWGALANTAFDRCLSEDVIEEIFDPAWGTGDWSHCMDLAWDMEVTEPEAFCDRAQAVIRDRWCLGHALPRLTYRA